MRKARIPLLALLVVFMTTSGCSVFMAASRSSYRGDVKVIKRAPRVPRSLPNWVSQIHLISPKQAASMTDISWIQKPIGFGQGLHSHRAPRRRLGNWFPLGTCRNPLRIGSTR